MAIPPVVITAFAAFCCAATPAELWLEAVKAAENMSAGGDYRGAEGKLREALKFAERIDPKGAETGVTWNNLGLVRQYMGDPGQAESCFLRSRDILRKLPGALALQVARPVNNLASLYLEEEHPEKVDKLDLKGLIARLKQEEATSPDLAVTMENMAGLRFLKNDLQGASDLYEQILDMRTRAQGPDSTDAAVVMHNLAAVRVRQNRLKEAEEYLMKSFRIWDAHPEYRNPSLVVARTNLGLIYALTGREEDSDRVHQEAIRTAGQLLGPGHRRTADVYNSYALALRTMKRKKEAGQMDARAREIRESTQTATLGSTVTYSDLLPRSSPRD